MSERFRGGKLLICDKVGLKGASWSHVESGRRRSYVVESRCHAYTGGMFYLGCDKKYQGGNKQCQAGHKR